jgi:TldD protein
MIKEEVAKSSLDAVLIKGGDFADIFAEERETTQISLEDGKIESFTSGIDTGAGLRVISADSTFFTYTESLKDESIMKSAAELAEAFKDRTPSSQEQRIISLKKSHPPVTHKVLVSPASVDRGKKADILKRADKEARTVSPHVKQVTVSLNDIIQRVSIVNSEGLFAQDVRVLTRLFVHVVAVKDDVTKTGYEAPGIAGGYELFDEEGPEGIARKAAERAITMLDAKPAPSGEMPVVLASGTSGVLFHEACGHGLEADAVRKGASVFAGKESRLIAAEIVSAADDPTAPNRWGSFSFDDEGTPAAMNVLIENGVMKSLMYDRLSAFQLKAKPTSNGRRQSFRFIPQPRMTNTFIMPGNDKKKDMFEGIEKGLYAVSLGGGEVNPATGDFVFGVTEGYLIENGQVKNPVEGAVLIGNGPRILLDIDRIAGDLKFDTGMCGKGGQSVPAGTGQPTMRIKRLTVGGTGS